MKNQQEKEKERSLEIIEEMETMLNRIKTQIEYDKKVDPYFFMLNISSEERLVTHSLGNMFPLTIIGLLEQYKISSVTMPKK